MVVSFDHLFQLNKIHSVAFQTVYEKLKIVIILPGTVQVSLFHISAEELSAQRIINDNYAKKQDKAVTTCKISINFSSFTIKNTTY